MGTALRLLGSFAIISGREAVDNASLGEQRLIVLLALRDRVISRSAVAGMLWPESSTSHAALRLRSTLTRLDSAGRSVVELTPGGLRLNAACAVDYLGARAFAEDLLEQENGVNPRTAAETCAAIALLCLELLPDSYDDWVLAEAEDWRLLRAAALEALTATLSADDRPHLAMGAARAAIRNEPLRETAQAGLIRLHLADGNQSEAMRVYERYCETLDEALHLTPSPILKALVNVS